jgi:hypothetical protein
MRILALLLVFLLVFGFIMLSGCLQLENTVGELQTCLDKCTEICQLVKNSSIEMEGFNGIGLSKQSGAVTVSCSCPC